MKFSIIVPVYKVESYLRDCVDSIITQNYSDLEVILVDDGSPDNSPQICDEYKKKDERVKVIHKENGGLSSARNAGLDEANGDYIIFVDSDDWIDNGCLKAFAETIEASSYPDVLMTVKTSVYEDGSFLEVQNFAEYLEGGFNKDRAVDWLLLYGKSVGAPNKVISRKLIEKYHLRFLKGILHEDFDWTFKICLYAETFCGYANPWYNYKMVREGSITNHITHRNINSIITTTQIYYDLFKSNKDELHRKIYHRSMEALYVSINRVKLLDDDGLAVVIKKLEDNKRILKYAGKFSQGVFLVSFWLLGASFSLKLLRRL